MTISAAVVVVVVVAVLLSPLLQPLLLLLLWSLSSSLLHLLTFQVIAPDLPTHLHDVVTGGLGVVHVGASHDLHHVRSVRQQRATAGTLHRHSGG